MSPGNCALRSRLWPLAGEAPRRGTCRRRISQAATRRYSESPLDVMYRIDGGLCLAERELEHLEGYRGSGPVRVGNHAATQLQLDIFGELLDSIYLGERQALADRGELMSYDDWRSLVPVIDWLCEHWQQHEEGIWEARSGRKHFTYSRLMSWVAIDRAIRIAGRRAFPADVARWTGSYRPRPGRRRGVARSSRVP